MLNLLREVAGENIGVIERELRCGVWIWHLRTEEMQWSRGFYQLLGIEPGTVVPSFAATLQVTHPDDKGPQAEVERIIKEASTIRRKFRVIRPGGSTAWISCEIIVLVDNAGNPEKALGFCTDVTDRQDELNTLRLAGERYRALVRAAGGVVWIAKSDGRVHEMTNCDRRGELQAVPLGSGWLQIVHPEDGRVMLKAWEEAIREKRHYDVVHRVREPDGTFKWKRSKGEPVFDDGGRIKEWVGISVDLEHGTGRTGNQSITGAQIRAARGMLRWSVTDLAAAAGISRAIIRRLEEADGFSPHDKAVLLLIEATLSKAGVEFFFSEADKPGVRPR